MQLIMPYPAFGFFAKAVSYASVKHSGFCCFRGSGGYALCKPISASFHLEETCGNGAYVMT
ncbi:MAG TPA: hypothetical protein DDY31_01240 [Lachnospiraceae bacterium]|nr:hypothetical protein [Lachnospiraceae bacterium]